MTDTRDLIYKLLEVADCYSDGRETYEPFEQVLREARSYLLNGDKPTMTEHNPIAPSPELLQEWCAIAGDLDFGDLAKMIYTEGANRELDACCEWMESEGYNIAVYDLLKARRPKPPSLKQQVLETLKYPKDLWSEAEVDAIRRLVEQLDD